MQLQSLGNGTMQPCCWFAVCDYIDKYGTGAACTSKPCEWNKGRTSYRSTKKLADCHAKEGRKLSITFDPRPEGSKQVPKTVKKQFQEIISGAMGSKPSSAWDFIFQNSDVQFENSDIQSDYDPDDSQKAVLMENKEQFLLELITDPLPTKPVEIVQEQESDR